jgi:hypothetical protein
MKGDGVMSELKIGSGVDTCPTCGGNLIPGTYDHIVGGEHLEHAISGEIRWMQHIILDVPAMICSICGSPWLRPDDEAYGTLQAYMETSAEQGVFVRTVRYRSLAETVH